VASSAASHAGRVSRDRKTPFITPLHAGQALGVGGSVERRVGAGVGSAHLVEQPQLAGLGLGVGGVHEHAAVQQRPVHIRHHAAHIAQALWGAVVRRLLALLHKSVTQCRHPLGHPTNSQHIINCC
jgi:hypothetical protein